VNLLKIMRNGLIGTLIAVVPAATTIAATRPSAAVPMAGSTSTAAAAQGYDDDHGISWLVWAGIGVAVVIALILLLDNDDDDDDSVSDG